MDEEFEYKAELLRSGLHRILKLSKPESTLIRKLNELTNDELVDLLVTIRRYDDER